MKKILVLGFLFYLVWSTTALADDSFVSLRYELKKGASVQYLLVVETDIIQNNSEPLITRHEKLQIRYGFKVSGPKDGTGYPISATYRNIGYDIKTPFEDYAYQNLKSARKELPANLLPYAGLIGTGFNICLSNRVAIDPPQTDLNPETTEKNSIASLLNSNHDSMITLQFFPSIVNDIFLGYPDSPEPKQTNDCWEQNLTLSNGRLVPHAKVLYTIGAITRDTFLLSLSSQGDCQLNTENSFSINGKENHIAEKLTAKLVGPLNGRFEVDKKSGLPLTGEIQLNLAGEVHRLDGVIPTTLKMTIHSQKI